MAPEQDEQKTEQQKEHKEHKERSHGSGPSISRREFAIGAIGSCLMLGLGTGAAFAPRDALNRPPGGQDEQHLLRLCLHCEKCREACPKNAIGPAHLEDGILNMRTPRMDFKKGWCDFCEDVDGGPRCAAVCPTVALTGASATPYNTVIGKAHLVRDWCLAARGMGCQACVDACPYDALSLGYDHVPVIDEDKCNGCGACEFACISLQSGSIAEGATDRAITVHPVTEE